MTADVRVVAYDAELEAAHREFARRMWPGKRRRTVPEYVRWKFRGSPDGPVPGLLLAVDGVTVLGQLGVIPVRLDAPGGVVDAQWACDLMVDPEARGRRLATRLFDAALEREALVLGSDASVGAHAVMTKMGFREVLGPWRMMFPSRPGAVGELVSRNRSGLRKRVIRTALPVALAAWKVLTPRGGGSSCRGDRWQPAAEVLAARPLGDGFAGIVHDREFFDWRFRCPTGFERAVVGVDDGGGGAALIEISAAESSLSDWTAATRRAASRVVGQALTAAAEDGTGWVRAYAQTPGERRMLMSLGFVPRSARVRILVDPRSPETLTSCSWRYTYCDSDENI